MKNSKIYLLAFLVVAFISTVYFVGCKQNTSEPLSETNKAVAQNISANKLTIDNLEIKALIENDIKELISIRNNFTQRVKSQKIEIGDLKTAYLLTDQKKIAELLNLSEEELAATQNQLKIIVDRMIKKVPLLTDVIKEKSKQKCSKCDVEKFFNNFYSYTKGVSLVPVKNSLKSVQAEAGTNCQWVQYGACLALCSLGGPIWYWPCAYLCLCSYCEGPEVDALCH